MSECSSYREQIIVLVIVIIRYIILCIGSDESVTEGIVGISLCITECVSLQKKIAGFGVNSMDT